MFDHVKRLRQQAVLAGESAAPTVPNASSPLPVPVQPSQPRQSFQSNPAKPSQQADQDLQPVDLGASVSAANSVRPRSGGEAISPAGAKRPKPAGDSSVIKEESPPKDFSVMPVSEQSAALLGEYRKSRIEFGMARMRMGAFLHIIKSNKLWEGVAESFDAFIASENINPHAARQYMSVAKTFIFDMHLPEDVLSKLSIAGISALDKAGKVIGEDNRDEVVEILANLSERDAIQRIMEMSTNEVAGPGKPALRVLRLLREYYEMPPDLQFDFLGKLSDNRRNQEALSNLTAASRAKRQPRSSGRSDQSQTPSDGLDASQPADCQNDHPTSPDSPDSPGSSGLSSQSSMSRPR